MKKIIFLCLLIRLLPCSSFAQEYSYTHYDITEGLAGSTVYCMAQDKDGFIWAATETGVSRFDGTHFQNFTTTDGLPDIEVLQMFGDSKGRVWMAPFRKSICYYYKGRIHNQENDSLLSRIRLRENVENFIEDTQGNVLIQENSALHVVMPDGGIRTYDSILNQPIRDCASICCDSTGHFRIQVGGQIFRLTEKGFSLVLTISFPEVHPNFIAMSAGYVVWRTTPSQVTIRSLTTGRLTLLPFERAAYRHISFTLLGDSTLYIDEMSGCIEYNIRSGVRKRFLPGKPISRVFRDMDGNLWFSTLGQGIFRLSSDEFKTKIIPTGDADQTSVHSICKVGSELWIGNDRDQIFRLSLPNLEFRGNVGNTLFAKVRIIFLDTLGNDKIFYGTDIGLIESKLVDHTTRDVVTGVKSVARRGDGNLLVATPGGVIVIDVRRWRVADTLWRERSTAVYSYLDTTYIGTLMGLYRLNGRRSIDVLGERVPFFRQRISAIARDRNGILWIASYGAGIIGYRHDSVVAIISKKNGLTSDICRNLYLHNNTLWVGTDQGLNKIGLDEPDYPITRYTSNDGLGSDIINAVYVDSLMVYVGTPAGLSYFDQSRVASREGCRLYLLSVLNSGKDRTADTAALVIPFADRNIQFGFAGISYRSVGEITYRYRMIGLDSIWRTTKQSLLEYPILPSGNYKFQLTAINKFGNSSGMLEQRFSVATPFWMTVWFRVLVVVVFAVLTWSLATWRIRGIRRRQREKDQLTKKMMEVERMAMQAQMNPHFIFNCLTSVQQYIFEQDILSANKYITGLARLIRLTLQHSALAFISLADEIAYLSAYLALEKLRFKEKMEYSIEADPDILQNSCYIPPMLIQPYVENSIRHGLRHKAAGGYIRVKIQPQRLAAERQGLTVIVEDDGIGRKMSASYKTSEHIEYQSKGMTLTADRIRMINIAYGGDIRVEVVDLEDASGQPAGTRVIMQLTLFDHLSKKEMQ